MRHFGLFGCSRRVWLIGVMAGAVVLGCSGSAKPGAQVDNTDRDSGAPGGGANVDSGFGNTGGSGTGATDKDAGARPIKCVPKTCKQLGTDCGPVANGCGNVVECGTCGKGKICGIKEHNVCTAPADLCKPATKAVACKDKECGITGDGCSGTIECGTCSSTQACGIVSAFQCDPKPVSNPNTCNAKITSCASVGAECGQIGNGCGGLIDCDAELGGCTGNAVCGANQPQTCGALPVCTPLTTATACAGKCGLVSDGCGPSMTGNGLIDCDADPTYKCASGKACGAGGVPNQCGDATMGGCVTVSKSTACGSATCGLASDGCSSSYSCGTCGTGTLCQNGSCVPACTPIAKATACASKQCGLVSDGCNATYDCGTCASTDQCGQKTAYKCDPKPPTMCVPLSAATACNGKKCGIVYDGCGSALANRIDCSTVNGGCTAGQFCGIKTPFQCNVPVPPTCTAAGSCAALGWACGTALDSCGNTYDCAAEGRTCNAATETCIGGITGPTTCQAGTVGPGGGTCGVCSGIPDCSAQPQVTKLTGRVITPGQTDSDTANQVGVPNAFVYILTSDDETLLPAIPTGIAKDSNGVWQTACDRCSDQNLGPVLTSATTDANGKFTLSGNIPVNKEFVLVVKIGKWRRAQKVTLPAGAACSTTDWSVLAANWLNTRLPRTRTDGLAVNIPHVAISTGKVDAMECVFEKMGVADGEFAEPGATGTAAQRIHMYASDSNKGEVMSTGSTAASALYGSETRLNTYDMVVFDCESSAYEHNTNDAAIRSYVNRGGRMFASHWSYTWLHDNGTLSYASATASDTRLDTSANWNNGNSNSPTSDTGYISVNRTNANSAKISTFTQWLLGQAPPAVTANGSDYIFTITDPRDLVASVNTGSDEWVYRFSGSATAGTAASCSCGSFACRQSNCPSKTTQGTCTGSCTWNPAVPPTPAPSTVQQYSFNAPFGAPSTEICGRVAYSAFHVAPGSGNFNGVVFPAGCSGDLTAQEKVLLYMLFDLASCVTTGGTPAPPACTPVTQNAACTAGVCGAVPNGCGGTINCGGCPTGQICGANNTCSAANCTKTDCAMQGATCGVVADGCGGTVTCPGCASGQVCGLFTPNQCAITCTPSNMATACAGKCGSVSDGCGGVHSCGGCSGNQVCINNTCQTGTCNPLTTCPSGLQCGLISDGCSGTVSCGTCTLPKVCGGAGQANVCGQPMCSPLMCSDVGANCGYIGTGCGGSTNCGTCGPGQLCGLGGANKCGGCMPLDCNTAGAECGQIGDGCGSAVDCGKCPAGQVCGAVTPNKCGVGAACKPQACKDVSAECGLIGDGCGGVVDCGKCISTQVCGIKSPNRCNAPPACQPQTCASAGAQCGAIGDGCGGLIDCGPCALHEQCGAVIPNKCNGVQ